MAVPLRRLAPVRRDDGMAPPLSALRLAVARPAAPAAIGACVARARTVALPLNSLQLAVAMLLRRLAPARRNDGVARAVAYGGRAAVPAGVGKAYGTALLVALPLS